MANFVLTNACIYVHSYDLGVHSNQVSVTAEAETVDNTTFGSGGYRSRRGGLKTVSAEFAGFHDSDPSASGFTELGVIDRGITVSAGGSEGDVAYVFWGGNFSYETLGAVGEMNPFTISSESTNSRGLVRTKLAKTKGSFSAAAPVGSAINLGAGGAGKKIRASVHIFSAGAACTVLVESSADQAFTSPLGVMNVNAAGAITAAGTYYNETGADSATNPWYRFNVTSCTGTFVIAGSIGIQ